MADRPLTTFVVTVHKHSDGVLCYESETPHTTYTGATIDRENLLKIIDTSVYFIAITPKYSV